MSEPHPLQPHLAYSQRETTTALVLALFCMAGIVVAAGTVVLWDVGDLRRRVESFFSVELDANKVLEIDAAYAGDSVEEMARDVMRGARDDVLAGEAKMPTDAPGNATFTPAPLPAPSEIRETPQAPPPPLSEPLENAEVRTADPGPDAVSVVSVPREVAPGPTVALPSGADATPDIKIGIPGEIELTVRPEEMPLPADAHAPGIDQLPTATRFSMPDGAGMIMRKLIADRPESGYPSMDDDIDATFDVYRVPGEPDAYFRLTLALKPASKVPTIPKDVLFLIDISQSISYKELEYVRAAVGRALGGLGKEDRWNVVKFADTIEPMHETFAAASAFDADAVDKFLRKEWEQRRTNVFDAAQSILSGLTASRRPCNVFLVSDGKATTGTSEVKQIVHGFQRANRDNFSVFTFNGGPKGNLYLLSLLSYRSRGVTEDCPTLERVPQTLAAFCTKFSRPVLSHTVASYTNIHHDDVVPQVLPNLYRDAPIVFWGRTTPGRVVTLRVAGVNVEGQPREFYFRATVPEGDRKNPGIAREWARGKAHLLIAQLADDPKNAANQTELVELAEHYRLEDILEVIRRNRWKRRQ